MGGLELDLQDEQHWDASMVAVIFEPVCSCRCKLMTYFVTFSVYDTVCTKANCSPTFHLTRASIIDLESETLPRIPPCAEIISIPTL